MIRNLPWYAKLIIGIALFFGIILVLAFLFPKESNRPAYIVVAMLVFPIIYYYLSRRPPSMQIRCPNCAYEGAGRYVTPGSFLVELILWCLLIVPGVVYSVWRTQSRRWICPQCDYRHVAKYGPVRVENVSKA